MIADSVEFLAGQRPPGARRHGALLRRLQGQPGVLPARARGGGRQGRQPRRAVRHQRRLAAARDRATSSAPCTRHVGSDVIVGIHCHDDTGCAVANSMAAVLAGAGHVQGTLNGLGERTGNANLTTVIPNLQLKLGYTCLPDGRIERLTAVSHHVAELLNRAVNPQAPYVGVVGVRPQGRPAHERHRPGQGRLRARRPGAGRQRHPLRRQRDGRAGDDHDEGRRARPGDGRPGGEPRSSTTSSASSTRATTSRRPTPRSSC